MWMKGQHTGWKPLLLEDPSANHSLSSDKKQDFDSSGLIQKLAARHSRHFMLAIFLRNIPFNRHTIILKPVKELIQRLRTQERDQRRVFGIRPIRRAQAHRQDECDE
jgi:hypothetical protein